MIAVMISSMTAFASKTLEAHWGSITWEIRSVNHRYLELAVRLPEPLRHLEKMLREAIPKHLHRGKVEVSLKFQPGQTLPCEIMVNQKLAQQLAKAAESLQLLFSHAQFNMMDVLSWPGMLQTKETHLEEVVVAAGALLQTTVEELVEVRQREGEGLQTYIEARLDAIQSYLDQIKPRTSLALQAGYEKMMARFEELTVNLDKERLEQEMVWLANKMDISEELQRLETHTKEVRRVLTQDTVVGRRLDFLLQELNREANTLSNKSTDSAIIQAAIELKVHIEQIREQVQNIE